MKTTRIGLVVGGVTLLLASAASASNMAFALRLQLGAPGRQELRFVALPYQYVPATAEEQPELCVAAVLFIVMAVTRKPKL